MTASHPLARRSLSAELAEDLDDELLDDEPGLVETLEIIESAAQWVRVAGHELRAAAPGALQGALTGLLTAGPAGAAVGAVAGGVGSRVGAGAPARSSGASARGVPSNAAGAQLLAALLRPETMQALGALALGTAGASAVPVAGTQVPVAAFANLLATLAAHAAAQQHASTPPASATPAYLAGTNATTSVARAEALLALLAEAEATEAGVIEDDDAGGAGDDGWDGWQDARWVERDLTDLDRLEAE